VDDGWLACVGADEGGFWLGEGEVAVCDQIAVEQPSKKIKKLLFIQNSFNM
jgi:hypothetical protein